jgi:hypothetical protein
MIKELVSVIKPYMRQEIIDVIEKQGLSYMGQDKEAVNLNQWDICSGAWALGAELNVKVYKFLKEPIIRKWGERLFTELTPFDKEIEKTDCTFQKSKIIVLIVGTLLSFKLFFE